MGTNQWVTDITVSMKLYNQAHDPESPDRTTARQSIIDEYLRVCKQKHGNVPTGVKWGSFLQLTPLRYRPRRQPRRPQDGHQQLKID